MKKLSKLMALLACGSLLFGTMFISCSGDDGGSSPDPKAGKLVLSDGGTATVDVDGTLEVYAAGKTAVDSFTYAGLTITPGTVTGVFTIAAAADAAEGSVAVNFNDGTETDAGINVTVYVYNPIYNVTMNIADDLKTDAATISVYYEGKEDSETTASRTDTVNAVYTAGAATAVVPFKKAKANDYKWINGIVVTVKDADGETIETECDVTNFCYSATEGSGYITAMNVTKKTSSKTFTINFSGFTVAGGSVEGLKYCNKYASSSSDWVAENIKTPAVTVATDGKSATFAVSADDLISDPPEFYIDWTQVVIKGSEGNAVSIDSGLSDANRWYSYSGSVWSISAVKVPAADPVLVYSGSLPSTTNGTTAVEFIAAADMPSAAAALIFTYTKGTDDMVSSTSTWITACSSTGFANETKVCNAWDPGIDETKDSFSVTVSDTDAIAAFIENGVFVAANSASYTGTLKVEYIPVSE